MSLYLAGGGNATQSFLLDSDFARRIQDKQKVLYIPVALDAARYPAAIAWFQETMAQHQITNVDPYTSLSQDVDLSSYGAVYMSGGNTYKLLQEMRSSGFDKKLLDFLNRGGVAYGGSAGAIIFGQDIDLSAINGDKNDVNLVDTTGLGRLAGFDIQCHFTPERLEPHQKRAQQFQRPILAIPETSGAVLRQGRLFIIGTEAAQLIYSDVVMNLSPTTTSNTQTAQTTQTTQTWV